MPLYIARASHKGDALRLLTKFPIRLNLVLKVKMKFIFLGYFALCTTTRIFSQV